MKVDILYEQYIVIVSVTKEGKISYYNYEQNIVIVSVTKEEKYQI